MEVVRPVEPWKVVTMSTEEITAGIRRDLDQFTERIAQEIVASQVAPTAKTWNRCTVHLSLLNRIRRAAKSYMQNARRLCNSARAWWRV